MRLPVCRKTSTRHAGHQLEAAEPPALARWTRHANRVVRPSVRVLLPIVVEIGRDIGHEPFQLWRRAYACLIELLRQNLGIGSQLRLVET